MATKKFTISLHRLEGQLAAIPFNRPFIQKATSSFFLVGEPNPKYVKPTFSFDQEENQQGIKDGRLPKVIFVSAAGATGKSELTKYLSATLGMPVFDLALHPPVASNSLTGLFFDTLGAQGLAAYVGDLEQGRAGMIIDALDEGHLKTRIAAFNAFLDDVAAIAEKATGTPFILLGRTNIVEHCILYLWEKGIGAELLHIEPFTVDQAKEFIDKRLGTTNYDQQYREVRDYIIASVQGFFRNESEISKKDSQNFIGYAPVLLSIGVLLKKTRNYKALYEELQSKDDKGVNLILDIVGLILKRDREDKIFPILREDLLKGRDKEFVRQVEAKAYTEEEQCIRILNFLLAEDPRILITDDPVFNQQYEEMASEWLREHPFIQNGSGKIQNAVFECYVLARLMEIPEQKDKVLRYLQTQYKGAFMLFFIFDKLSVDRKIDPAFLPYLFNSLKSLDDKKNYYGMEIQAEQEEADDIEAIECDVEFGNAADPDFMYKFKMTVEPGTSLAFTGEMSNLDINAPIVVRLKARRLEFCSPVHITCSRIELDTGEFVFEAKEDGDILLECESFDIDYSSGPAPQVFDYGNEKSTLVILCETKPSYPFSEYYQEGSSDLSLMKNGAVEKYLRLRKILMLFRSHSKGNLGKLKDKIEAPRVLKNGLGRDVLNKLINAGVIYSGEHHLYMLDKDAVHKRLGISYQDLKRKQFTKKTVDFLDEI